MARTRGTVLTPGQFKDLATALIQATPTDLPSEVAQRWIGNKAGLAKGLRQLLMPSATVAKRRSGPQQAPTAETPLSKWARFYQEVFGRQVDPSNLQIPTARGDINSPLVMADGLTAQELFEKCRERFGAWKFCAEDLQVTSDRDQEKGAYIILVRYRIEADEEHAGKSAEVMANAGVTGITLEERLLLELFYHWCTGGHLDMMTGTLCSGSRFADGRVPGVDWSDDELKVFSNPDCSDAYLRAREVVSGPTAREA